MRAPRCRGRRLPARHPVRDRSPAARGPTAPQHQQLRDLAALVVDQLERRRNTAALEASRRHVELTSMATRASLDAILITLGGSDRSAGRPGGRLLQRGVHPPHRVCTGRHRRQDAARAAGTRDGPGGLGAHPPAYVRAAPRPAGGTQLHEGGRAVLDGTEHRAGGRRHGTVHAHGLGRARHHRTPRAARGAAGERAALPAAVPRQPATDVGVRQRDAGLPRRERHRRGDVRLQPGRVPLADGARHPPRRGDRTRASGGGAGTAGHCPQRPLAPHAEGWPRLLRADLVVSGHVRGSPRAAGARPRHHRREGTRRTAGPGPEDGGRGPVGRRCGPRLQQPPHGDQRLRTAADLAAARGRSAARRCRTHPAGRRAGVLAHAAVAGIQPSSGAAAAAARRRGRHRPPPSDARSPPAGRHRRPHHPAVVAAARDGGPGAARTGAAQPRDQRLGRHARRRHAVARGRGGRRGRRDGRSTGPARGPLRRPGDVGHRRGHDRGDPRAHLRAVLHDQGQGSRVRPRPAGGVRHRQAERRHHRGAHDAGPGVHVHRLPAAGRRASRRGRGGGSHRPHGAERSRDRPRRGRSRGRASLRGRRPARAGLPGAGGRARPGGHRTGRGPRRQGRPAAHRRDHAAHGRTRGRDGAAAAHPRHRRPLHERLHADRDRAGRRARAGTQFPRQAVHAGRTAGARPRGAGGPHRGSRRRHAGARTDAVCLRPRRARGGSSWPTTSRGCGCC